MASPQIALEKPRPIDSAEPMPVGWPVRMQDLAVMAIALPTVALVALVGFLIGPERRTCQCPRHSRCAHMK